MAGLKYDKVIKYKITAKCDGPLRIGSANGGKEEVLIHPVDGEPFIQATSIAGSFRDYCDSIQGPTDALFGKCSSDLAEDSRVKFSDGRFLSAVKLERRPHVKIDRKSGSAAMVDVNGTSKGSGQKFELEYIGADQTFSFETILYIDSKMETPANLEQFYEDVLSGIGSRNVRFGGKKSTGAGIVSLEKAEKIVFELTEEDDLTAWIENRDTHKEDITEALRESKESGLAYRITIVGKTEGELQVRGLAENEFGKGAADSSNIKNANGHYIIPGSSVKGAIRSQMEKIAEYLQVDNVIDDTFGKVKDADKEGSSGNILFHDVALTSVKTHRKTRVHLNKFTGGVINPFVEDNVSGELEIAIDIADKNCAKRTLGLLLFAIRDLHNGSFSLGNGYANGKGIICINKVVLKEAKSDKVLELDFSGNDKITAPIVVDAIKALKKGDEN